MSPETNISLQDAIQLALEHHQAGRLAEAERTYRKVLEAQPNHPEVLHFLGVIALQCGRYQPAAELIEQALRIEPSKPDLLIDLGAAYRLLGRSADAERCYRAALALQPDRAEAHNNLGNVLRDLKRLKEAEEYFRQSLALKPSYVEAHNNLGNTLIDLKRLDEAEKCFLEAAALNPEHPETQHNLGNVLRGLGRLREAEQHLRRAAALKPDFLKALVDRGNILQQLKHHNEAIASYDKALTIQPDAAEVLTNRGVALQELKRHDEALASYDRALTNKPDYAEALSNRGAVLQELRRYSEALASYDKALTINPDYAVALSNRGNTLYALGRYSEALSSYDKALMIKSDFSEALSNRGNALRDLGRLQEAEVSYRQALALKPDFFMAHNNLGDALKDLGRPQEAEESYRRALALKPDYAEAYSNFGNALADLGRFEEADRSYRQALALKPDFAAAHSNLIFAMDLAEGHDIKAQQAERRRWHELHGQKYATEIQPHENSPDPKRTLRVGYVSADFRRHSAYYVFSPVLYAHDRSAFEVYCYSGVKREDDATARLREVAQGWRSTVGVSDTALAEQIRSDRIDILVDLAGHSSGNRLPVFARKPAPVQVTAWGHALGTGLDTIDYFLADPVLVPKKERTLFAEKVLDLPCVICYEAPAYAPEVHPLPALGGKPFTFGCINRIEKISDRSLSLWGQIMAALPEAGLLFKDHKLGDARLREDFVRRLGTVGIKPERVRLAGGSPHAEHLKIYHEVDIGLDPFPHGGGVSTAEALWMGVPVVTLPGQTLPSRLSASILAALDMQKWIARNDADYVRIAVKAAGDLPRLAALRQGLRAHMAGSAVGDAKRYTAAVEQTYRSMWQRWCKLSPQRNSS